MKLKTIIFGAFALMAIISLLVGVTGVISTNRLANDSGELKKLLSESSGVRNVLNAHFIWRQMLMESVQYGTEFKGSLDSSTCALGKWITSDEAKGIEDAEILAMLSTVHGPHDYIHSRTKDVVALMDEGKQDEAAEIVKNEILPKTQEVIDILSAMQSKYGVMREEMNVLVGEHADSMSIIIILVVVFAFAVCVVLAWLITSFVIKPLVPLTEFMVNAGKTGNIVMGPADVEFTNKYSKRKDEIAQCISSTSSVMQRISNVSDVLETISYGDLTTELSILSDSDKMGMSLQRMSSSLNNAFKDIYASSSQVSSGAKQVADGAQALAQGSSEQAASIEELSGSIIEIADKTKANAATADNTARLSTAMKEKAEKGSRQMDEMITAVVDINEASKNISKIIKTIDDIAFQTNILALNAAVEAARAGQHGKGFAVVAEEVRNLASKSAEAAKDTGNMIQNSMDKAELGTRIARDTAVSLAEIVTDINESSNFVSEIAKSSEEQSVRIQQINVGIDQVAQVVQQNSATAEESAAASEEMSGQSDMLQQIISQFKLKEDEGMYRNSLSPATKKTATKRLVAPEKYSPPSSGRNGDFGKY